MKILLLSYSTVYHRLVAPNFYVKVSFLPLAGRLLNGAPGTSTSQHQDERALTRGVSSCIL